MEADCTNNDKMYLHMDDEDNMFRLREVRLRLKGHCDHPQASQGVKDLSAAIDELHKLFEQRKEFKDVNFTHEDLKKIIPEIRQAISEFESNN